MSTRDECIVTMLEESGGMIRNFARAYNLDFDDCFQQAALIMLEAYNKIPDGANPKPYLHRSVRNRLIDWKIKQDIKLSTLSLDAPVVPGASNTLADVLIPNHQKQDTQRLDHIIDRVHKALFECMLEEQEYVVKIFEMYAFSPVAPSQRRRGLKEGRHRTIGNIRRSILGLLRQNLQLQALLK